MNSRFHSLFKKEIKSFFGSLTGYLAIIVFLLMNSLFLWVFPGNYNIPENNYATLDGLFSLAPWLYLFLVPAVTMRLLAEEKKQGTLETLLSRPLGSFTIILGKYLAGLALVLFSLLPTLLYFLSVYLLGNPVGSIDTGGTWGAFIGLFFLAAIYVAIGLFASALTDNQIVSFIAAMAFSFVFYLGFEFIGTSGVPYFLEKFFTWMSINEHYLSISRGVIDLRDLVYFIGITVLFLLAAQAVLSPGKFSFKRKKNELKWAALVVVLFILFSNYFFRIDLTADKRYSLSPVSREIAGKLEFPVEAELFLEGELPPGFRRLQQAVAEKIADFNAYSSRKIRLKITDPYQIGNTEKRNAFFKSLAEKGIQQTDIRQRTEQGVSTKLIFPGAMIRYGDKEVAAGFLKNSPGFSAEANLNHSVEGIEFELANALNKLISGEKKGLAFLTGHGELNQYEVASITNSLAPDFFIGRITSGELFAAPEKYKVLIIANPEKPFPEPDKLAIDQYIMRGGRVMWLIDPVNVSLDSLSNGFMTVALPRDINLGDQLFRYGVRLNSDLLQDVVCSKILVNTAPLGSQAKFTPENWYYSPLLTPSDNHELSRNLNFVQSEFVSSIDTVSGDSKIRKSVILSTSPYARIVKTPTGVSLQNINNPPARELFNTAFIPAGILLEGKFTSVFKNRMVSEYGFSESEIINESPPVKMIVIADGNLIANKVNYSGGEPKILPLGFDRVTNQTFGNSEFLINALQYLADDTGLMQLRNRSFKLRLLDQVRLREEKFFWQWLNVLAPVFLVITFGFGYNLIRRRRFSR